MFAQSVFNAMHRPTLSGMTQPRWGWDGLSGRFSQGTPLFPVLNQAVHQVILLATHRFGLSCRKERGTLGWRAESRWDCLSLFNHSIPYITFVEFNLVLLQKIGRFGFNRKAVA